MERFILTCSSCGGNLSKIENQENAYVCLHCGKTEIIKAKEKSSNYQIEQNIVKNIYGNEKPDIDDYYKICENAEKFLAIEDFEQVLKLVEEAKKIDIGNYLAWWISTKTKLIFNIRKKEMSDYCEEYSSESIQEDYKKAYNFAYDAQKDIVKNEYNQLINNYNNLSNKNQKFISEGNFKTVLTQEIIGVSVLAILAGLMMIIGFIIYQVSNDSSLIIIPFFGFIFLLIAISTILKKVKCRKVILFINQRVKIDVKAVYNYSISIKAVADEEEFRELIKRLIDKEYLYNYEIKENYFIRKENIL